MLLYGRELWEYRVDWVIGLSYEKALGLGHGGKYCLALDRRPCGNVEEGMRRKRK